MGTFYSYKFLGLSPEDGGPLMITLTIELLRGLSKYDTYTRVTSRASSQQFPVV